MSCGPFGQREFAPSSLYLAGVAPAATRCVVCAAKEGGGKRGGLEVVCSFVRDAKA